MPQTSHRARPSGLHGPNRPGWTMVELVIVLAVLSVLLAVAYPVYNGQLIKARRADGHALLYEAAQRQQQFFTSNNHFTDTIGSGGLEMSATSDEGYYTLSITSPSATSYTLTATPAGAQTSDTSCGDLTLTHLNVKGCGATDCEVQRCW